MCWAVSSAHLYLQEWKAPIGCSDQTQEDALGQQDQCASTSYDPIKDPKKGGVKQILSLEMVAVENT